MTKKGKHRKRKKVIPLTKGGLGGERVGDITSVKETPEGLVVTGVISDKHKHLLGGTSFTGSIPKEGL